MLNLKTLSAILEELYSQYDTRMVLWLVEIVPDGCMACGDNSGKDYSFAVDREFLTILRLKLILAFCGSLHLGLISAYVTLSLVGSLS